MREEAQFKEIIVLTIIASNNQVEWLSEKSLRDLTAKYERDKKV
jgi:hypothetical protein